MHRFLVLLAVAAALAACSATIVGPGPVPSGTWGGSQGNLVIYADSAALDLPCAAGRIPAPLATDASGAFDVSGLWAPQVGPVRVDGPDWRSARFTGRRTGDLLQVNVQLAGGVTVGPLAFRRGVVGQFPRCL